MLIPTKYDGYSPDGRRLYYFDLGDGGGGGGSQPSNTSTQTTELPEWARGYAKSVLARGAALTDINQNPYQTYNANRIAGFTPMQQRAQQNAANMQFAPQLGTATDLASAAGMGALNTSYKPGDFSALSNYQPGTFSSGTFGEADAKQYMNPYQQAVTDIGKREAARQSDIRAAQEASQATQSGAFGGSRFAIQQAERDRNLGQQMADIQAQGSNAAFQAAMAQYNADQARRMQAQQMGEQSRQFGSNLGLQGAQLGEQSRQYGAGLGLQGLQTGLQAAGQLGQLGGQQFQQGMDINKLQSTYGGQMQQQAQRYLDQDYQDFLNQQNYPYKQLGFFSDLARGLPLGQQSTKSIYDQGPGMVQTLAGLSGAAYGFGRSGLFKEGGLTASYAEGGVTSPQNIENILPKLSDQQLKKAKEAALNRRDIVEAQMIDAEMAERASIRGGLGNAFNQIPEDQQEQMMADGGIVAFAPGGVTYKKQFESSMDTLKDLSEQQPEPLTPEQYEQGVTARQPMLEKIYGQDITKPYLEETKTKRMGLADQLEKDKGLALAAASLGLLARKRTPGESQRNQLISGLGEAGQQFASEVGKLQRDSREADDKLRQSEILLATAQQQRKEGMANKAMSLEDKADDKRQEYFKTKAGIQEKVAQLQSGLAQTEMQGENALKVAGIHAAVQREMMNKPGEVERMMSDIDAIRNGKKSFQGKTGEEGAKAYQDTLGQVGAARYGVKYTGQNRDFEHEKMIEDSLNKNETVKMWRLEAAQRGTTPERRDEISRLIEMERQKIASRFPATQPSVGAPAPQQSTGTPMPKPGQVIQGYRFKGGDPANPASWEKE